MLLKHVGPTASLFLVAAVWLPGAARGQQVPAARECVWPSPDSLGWTRDVSPQVSVSVPPGFPPATVQWRDSRYATWTTDQVRIVSDYGTETADGLPREIRSRERAYQSCDATINSRAVQVVTYVDAQGAEVVEGFWRDLPALLPRSRGYFWIRVEHRDAAFRANALRILRSVAIPGEVS